MASGKSWRQRQRREGVVVVVLLVIVAALVSVVVAVVPACECFFGCGDGGCGVNEEPDVMRFKG